MRRARAKALPLALALALAVAAQLAARGAAAGERAAGAHATGKPGADDDNDDDDGDKGDDQRNEHQRAASDDGEARPARHAVERKDVGPLVDRLFSDKKPAFCSDPLYPLTPDELGWCPLLPAKDARCPTLQQACLRGAHAEMMGRRRSTEISLPDLPLPGRALMWVLLGAGFLFLVYQLAKQALGQLQPRSEELRVAPAPAGPSAEEIKARVVETDVARLLALAQAAAARGDYGQALAESYAALLRKLEGADLVRVEAHRTNGDHLRDVSAKRPPLRPPVAEVVATVEEVEFGGQPPTAERWQEVHRRVLGVVGQWLGVLVAAIGLLGLAGAGAGCSTERAQWDESPSGRAGVIRFLRSYGFEVHERFASLAKVGDTVDQIVVVPGSPLGPEGSQALEAWVRRGGTLVLAGVDPPDWVGGGKTASGAKASAALHVADDQLETFGRLRIAAPGEHRLEGFDGKPLLLRGALPYAAEKPLGTGRLVLLADDYLFTNAALLAADDARFVAELLRAAGARLDVANELTGLAAETPLESVKRGRLAPVLCQLAALTLLFFLFKGVHFGRPIDPVAERRRAFSEHARAVGLRYALARANRLSLELYTTYAFERLRDRLNLGAARTLSATAEAVSARTGRPLGEVMRVLVEAREVLGAPPADGAKSAKASASENENDLLVLRQVAALVAETHPQRTSASRP